MRQRGRILRRHSCCSHPSSRPLLRGSEMDIGARSLPMRVLIAEFALLSVETAKAAFCLCTHKVLSLLSFFMLCPFFCLRDALRSAKLSQEQQDRAIRRSHPREWHMKLHFASVAVIACLSAAMPAQAAVTVIGKGQIVDCFQAAAKASRGALPMMDRNDGLASCSAALADKILAKDRTATLINRGLIETSAGEADKAIADFDAALVRDANMSEAYIGRGLALLRAERYEQARADFDRALALGTDNAHIAYFDRGVAQEKAGNIAAAYRDYKQALAIAPDFRPASDELSRFRVVDKRVAQNR